MKLAIFDIDDTLAQTGHVFDPYYFASLAEHVGSCRTDRPLGAWSHVTDEGIARQAMREAGQEPTAATMDLIKARYLSLMRAHVGDPEPVAGAQAMLDVLAHHPEWCSAIATGNWEEAGRLKLALAGLRVGGIPFAGCDGRPEREIVMRHASALSAALHETSFERIVYVGDGLWDVAAARALNWAFLGVGPRRGDLMHAGASHIVPDLGDVGAVLHCLEQASPPAAPHDTSAG